MKALAGILFAIALMAALFYAWTRMGQDAPGRKPPPPPPPPAKGDTTKELGGLCHKLKRDGQGAKYTIKVVSDPAFPNAYLIADTRADALDTGLEAKLTHKTFGQGGLRQTLISNGFLTQGDTTADFNGALALPSARNPADFVVWEAEVRPSAGTVPFPESLEICVDVKKAS